MRFLTPLAFWFAAALPVVVLFYLLKRKRVLKLVPSTLLWEKFLAETRASQPFQRLRHNWLLILQLLLLTLVILALTRPYWAGQAQPSRLRVLILDASASMQATDEKPSRFEQARAQALRWVDGLGRDEQMMVLQAGARTEVLQSATTDKTALRRALAACTPSESPTRLAEALKTASAFTFEKRGEEEVSFGEIHLFSDGMAPDLEEMAHRNLPLVYHRIGRSGNNLGIVALETRTHPEDPTQRAIFLRVGNFSTNAWQTELELSFEGRLLETRPLNLDPTNTVPLVFFAPQEQDGVFTVRLTARDDLAADNQASAVSLLPQPARALLVTRGNRFLEKALEGAPGLRLTVLPVFPETADDYDLVVLDDLPSATWPKVNTLAIHTINPDWFETWQTVAAPPIVDWRSAHPLLRFVNFDNVQIAETLAVKTPPWAVPLVDSPQTPLILAGETQGRRIVWIGFDTLQSTWPLRVSFPIFIANAVEWLHPGAVRQGQFMVRAGQPFRLTLPQPVATAQLTRPDGTRHTLALDPGATELLYGDTFQQGTYRLQAGTNHFLFCVNLLDPFESQIQPRDELPLGKHEAVAATSLKQANLEWWRWLAAAGLLLLLFEWWYYHKRTV